MQQDNKNESENNKLIHQWETLSEALKNIDKRDGIKKTIENIENKYKDHNNDNSILEYLKKESPKKEKILFSFHGAIIKNHLDTNTISTIIKGLKGNQEEVQKTIKSRAFKNENPYELGWWGTLKGIFETVQDGLDASAQAVAKRLVE